MDSVELTRKEECFCYEYVLHLNATKAASLAGYSGKTARQAAARLLSKVYIQNEIRRLRDNLSEAAGISALRVLKEHEKIAFADAGQLRDGWMSLKDFDALTGDQKACIQSVSSRQVKRTGSDGAPLVEDWVKIKLYDKQKSLDSINAMLGFNAPEKREITGRNGKDLFFDPVRIEIIDSREKVDAKDTDNESV